MVCVIDVRLPECQCRWRWRRRNQAPGLCGFSHRCIFQTLALGASRVQPMESLRSYLLSSLNAFLLFLATVYIYIYTHICHVTAHISSHDYLFQHGNLYLSPKYLFGLVNFEVITVSKLRSSSRSAREELSPCAAEASPCCSRHLETCHGLVEDVRLAHHPSNAAHDPRSCSCVSRQATGSRGEHCPKSMFRQVLMYLLNLTQTIGRYPKTIVTSLQYDSDAERIRCPLLQQNQHLSGTMPWEQGGQSSF